MSEKTCRVSAPLLFYLVRARLAPSGIPLEFRVRKYAASMVRISARNLLSWLLASTHVFPGLALLAGSTPLSAPPVVCFVVRTYWGHGDAHGGELRSLLSSLQDQTVSRWEAVLVMVDKQPFSEAHDIIRDLNETSRAWIYTEWIGEEYSPKQSDGGWSEGYHGMLYNVTDDAIRVCSPETEWVVATNGDNLYGRHFIHQVLEKGSDPSVDLVAFDFYSRYQRPTMPSCDRFSSEPAWLTGEAPAAPCKRNTLQWCQTDLGSVAIRRKRLLDEDRSFGLVTDKAGSLDAAHNDGLLFAELVHDGWTVSKVEDECLFAHNPSFQTCAWKGLVWDDSNITRTGGGECIGRQEAARRLKDPTMEMVSIFASHPANYMGEYREVTVSLDEPADCIRRRDFKSKDVWGHACWWFPDGCIDAEDREEHGVGLDLYYEEEEDAASASGHHLEL